MAPSLLDDKTRNIVRVLSNNSLIADVWENDVFFFVRQELGAFEQPSLREWIARELAAWRAKRDDLARTVHGPDYDHAKHFGLLQQWHKAMGKIAWLQSFDGQVEVWERMEKATAEFGAETKVEGSAACSYNTGVDAVAD